MAPEDMGENLLQALQFKAGHAEVPSEITNDIEDAPNFGDSMKAGQSHQLVALAEGAASLGVDCLWLGHGANDLVQPGGFVAP